MEDAGVRGLDWDWSWLPLFGWRDVADVALVAVLVWLAIRYYRQTRARTALAGLALLGGVYLVARGLDLRLASGILEGFFTVLVLVLVVVFQEDLRRVFEQLGSWWSQRGEPETVGRPMLDVLVRTVSRLAATRTGALIVIPGRDPLERHLEGGIRLDGRLSEPLLLSIFDASSPGHDGAVLVHGDRIVAFALHLPLSANHAALGPGGTRHAAALGLAERSDATCIVVSEERGTVSLARGGELRVLSRAEDLLSELRPSDAPAVAAAPWWRRRAGRDAVLATAIAAALWLVLVPGAAEDEIEVEAPVRVTNLPSDLALESVAPKSVTVTLRGLRRDLILARNAKISVQLDAYLAQLGRRTFSLSEQDVRGPERVSVVALSPDKVRLSLAEVPAEAPQP